LCKVIQPAAAPLTVVAKYPAEIYFRNYCGFRSPKVGPMKKEQYVCLACGFNMVGFHPDTCGAQKGWFITAE